MSLSQWFPVHSGGLHQLVKLQLRMLLSKHPGRFNSVTSNVDLVASGSEATDFTYPEEVAKAGETKSVAAEKALKHGQPGKR